MRVYRIAALALLTVTVGSAAVVAQAPEIKYGPAPAVFPAGARMAVLHGDPGKAEQFIVRLDFPSGYAIPPHWHPTDEFITVIHGKFMIGMGDKVETSKMMLLPASGFAAAPAKMNHYARAKGHTIVQISSMGPFAMTYVNAADDPSKRTVRK